MCDAELEKEPSRAAEASRVEAQCWKEKAEASQVKARRWGQKAEGEFRRLPPLLWLVFLCAHPHSVVFGIELEKEVTQAAEASAVV